MTPTASSASGSLFPESGDRIPAGACCIRGAAEQNCTREPAFGEAQPAKIERSIKRIDNPIDAGREMIKATGRFPLSSGKVRLAELHWYEAHGIGKKEFKRKRYLE